MANQLIPQKRVDKNNRVVTRHVSSVWGKANQNPVMPAPAIAQQFRVKPQDVKKPRRPGTSKSDLADARLIRDALSVRPEDVTSGSVDMSDNEMYEFMKMGFRITHAVEFQRYGADPESAQYVGLPRNAGVIKSVGRMQSMGLPPEHAARIIRHGLSDRMLDSALTDQELFDLLYKENLNSTKYAARSIAARQLISGGNTAKDAAELGMEALGTYGATLRNRRRDGLPIDYEVIRSAIVRYEEPPVPVPPSRRDEGWYGLDRAVWLPQIMQSIDKHGVEVLEFKHLSLFTMNRDFGGTMGGYKYMDEFFSLIQHDTLSLNDEQRLEMWQRDPSVGRQVADFVEMLRQDGLTPEQTASSLRSGLTLDKAFQIHINKLSPAMIEGWL